MNCLALLAYEMRTVGGVTSKREATFNTTKKGKEDTTHEEVEEDSNTVVANFVIKLKKGSGKYEGKLPFKCFNYGKIGHFATKCPYVRKIEMRSKTVDLLVKKR